MKDLWVPNTKNSLTELGIILGFILLAGMVYASYHESRMRYEALIYHKCECDKI